MASTINPPRVPSTKTLFRSPTTHSSAHQLSLTMNRDPSANAGHSRKGSSASRSPSAPASPPQNGERQNLLTPVVRSKRTPIACTECRRRQVKCTGASPQCERCERRGIKCEYIPCSQQKASSSSPPMPPRVPDPPQSMPAYPAGTSRHRPSSSWQQAGTHQAYFSGGSHPYQQQGDWGNAPLAASATEAQLVPQYYGGAPVQTRTGRTYYSGEQFGGQATYDYQNYRDSSTAQPVSSSHPAYAGGPFPSAYPTPDMDMGSGDLTLSYSYSADRTMATNQTRLHPQQSGYTEQYQQGGNDVYRAAASGMVSNTSHQGWLSDPNYLAYHPSLYGQ